MLLEMPVVRCLPKTFELPLRARTKGKFFTSLVCVLSIYGIRILTRSPIAHEVQHVGGYFRFEDRKNPVPDDRGQGCLVGTNVRLVVQVSACCGRFAIEVACGTNLLLARERDLIRGHFVPDHVVDGVRIFGAPRMTIDYPACHFASKVTFSPILCACHVFPAANGLSALPLRQRRVACPGLKRAL
jgi:hypothetical protein